MSDDAAREQTITSAEELLDVQRENVGRLLAAGRTKKKKCIWP